MISRYIDFLLEMPNLIGFTIFMASAAVALAFAVVALFAAAAIVVAYPAILPLLAAIQVAWLGYCIYYAVRFKRERGDD